MIGSARITTLSILCLAEAFACARPTRSAAPIVVHSPTPSATTTTATPSIAQPVPPLADLVCPAPTPIATAAAVPAQPAGESAAASAHVAGYLTEVQILDVMRANEQALKACFEEHAPAPTHLRLVMRWRIDLEGKVAWACLDAPRDEQARMLASCFVREIKAWQFPHPNGGQVEVSFPFARRGPRHQTPTPTQPRDPS